MAEWPAQNKYISQATTRVDAVPKLTGAARYSSDIQASGWVYGMILRSKWPAAKIVSVNFEKAKRLPGVKAVVLARETPFTVRFYGEEIAGIAATSKEACLDALRAIEVTAEPRERFAVREEEARKADSPQVWEGVVNAPAPRERRRIRRQDARRRVRRARELPSS